MTGGSTDYSVSGGHRTRGALIVAEIAMAMVLLVGAGLLANSFVRLTRVDPGYDTAGIETFQVALPPDRYQIARVRTFADDLVRRLEQVPGVDGVAFARQLPMVQLTDVLAFGRAPNSPQQAPPSDPKGVLRAEIRLVSHDYLHVMRVPVVRGRPFGPGDGTGAPRVVLVNEAMAHASFPGQDPIGQLVQPTRDSIPWEVVGIVKDMRQFSLDRAPDPQMFFDVRQVPDNSFPIFPLGPYYIVRTTARRATLMSTVRSIVNQMEAQAAVYNVAAMDDIMSNGVSRARLYAVLVAAFAAIGGSLAAIGIYGAIAYSVGLRTREIGVRIALGARRSDVMTMVFGRTAAQAAIGIALGLAGAAAVSRYLRAMLFGLTPLDPATFFAVALMFSAVAALAAFIPARRATRVDPLVALRCE